MEIRSLRFDREDKYSEFTHRLTHPVSHVMTSKLYNFIPWLNMYIAMYIDLRSLCHNTH